MRGAGVLVLTLFVAVSGGALANDWHFDAMTGLPFNARSDLRIEQSGYAAIELNAKFESEPFTPPIYWALRLERGNTDRAWAVELMHHKLYLRNRHPDIESFSVTHGFNLLTLQRGFGWHSWQWRLGIGAVLAHPESTVRGLSQPEDGGWFDDGHRWAGPAFLAGIGRRGFASHRFGLVGELRLSVAPVEVPVARGDAKFTNVALHLILGVSGRSSTSRE